jgi:catechol 2,3-dioxygenase-like lactoylglutathione lyase family enzyme
MIDYVHSATVNVRDLDAAIDFYVNTLGFEKTSDMPMPMPEDPGYRWVTVRPQGSTTMIALNKSSEAPRPEQGNSGISFIAKDLDQTYQELTAKGVAFDSPPETMPWGAQAAWFSDPDGNSFFITDMP